MNYCQFRNQTIKRMANAGSVAPILPDEYQQVEYLESSNTQYINTGIIIPTNYERVIAKILCTNNVTSNRYFGSYNASPARASILLYKGSGPFDKVYIGDTDATIASTSANVDYIIDITADNGVLSGKIGNTNINRSYSSTVATGRNERLFGQGGDFSATCYARIYYFKLFTSAGLQRDYIPCYRKSDNKPGMYDLVTDTFFTNAGTGEFTVGNDV